jgi:hypothetical protein
MFRVDLMGDAGRRYTITHGVDFLVLTLGSGGYGPDEREENRRSQHEGRSV